MEGPPTIIHLIPQIVKSIYKLILKYDINLILFLIYKFPTAIHKPNIVETIAAIVPFSHYISFLFYIEYRHIKVRKKYYTKKTSLWSAFSTTPQAKLNFVLNDHGQKIRALFENYMSNTRIYCRRGGVNSHIPFNYPEYQLPEGHFHTSIF